MLYYLIKASTGRLRVLRLNWDWYPQFPLFLHQWAYDRQSRVNGSRGGIQSTRNCKKSSPNPVRIPPLNASSSKAYNRIVRGHCWYIKVQFIVYTRGGCCPSGPVGFGHDFAQFLYDRSLLTDQKTKLINYYRKFF